LEFKADAVCTKGEQVYINYGRYSNCHLFRLYGFVVQDNPHDSIDIWTTMGCVSSAVAAAVPYRERGLMYHQCMAQ